MQGVKGTCEVSGDSSHHESDTHNPRRTPETRQTAAQRPPAFKRQSDGGDEPSQRDEVEPVLERTRSPDDRKNKAEANKDFPDVPRDALPGT